MTSERLYTVRGRHLSGLDGLRSLAVMGVVAYHLHISRLSGGYLGVDLFFVISGFLITSLLLEEHQASSAISLVSFWGRRAKRLLPALFLMLIVVVTSVSIAERHGQDLLLSVQQLRGDAISTVFYVANWYQIATSQSYFALFSNPSPLEHTWSLAIEEQFYLIFPFVVLLYLAYRKVIRRGLAAGILLALALASAIEMALLFHPGSDPSRIYYGTDTRAFDLLIGSALGVSSAGRGIRSEKLGRALAWVVWPAALALGAFWVTAGTRAELPKSYMYRGGFLLCSVLAATVVAAVALRPGSAVARVLSIKPLVAIGIVSYGIYLWHWPVIVLYNPATSGLSRIPLDLVRIAIIAGLATASYYVVERPIRRHRFTRKQVWLTVPTAFAVTVGLALLMTSDLVAAPPGRTDVVTAPYTGIGADHRLQGAGGFGVQTPIHLDRRVSRSHPLRVLFIGDSLFEQSESGFAEAFSSTHEIVFASAAIAGFNLENGALDQLALARLAFHPDVIVGLWGWDNATALRTPQAYRKLLAEAMHVFTAGKGAAAGVILIPAPIAGPPPSTASAAYRANFTSPKAIDAWTSVAEQVAASMPGNVMVLPAERSVLLPGGEYSTWLPPNDRPSAPYRSWMRARKVDGYHLCQNGTVRFATVLLSDFQYLFGVAPAEGPWWSGSWIHNESFNVEPEICPNDHPPSGTSLARPAPPTG